MAKLKEVNVRKEFRKMMPQKMDKRHRQVEAKMHKDMSSRMKGIRDKS